MLARAAYAVGARRALTGMLVAAVGLPLLTLPAGAGGST